MSIERPPFPLSAAQTESNTPSSPSRQERVVQAIKQFGPVQWFIRHFRNEQVVQLGIPDVKEEKPRIRIPHAKLSELLSEDIATEIESGRKKLMVVFGAGGDNARRFSEGWGKQEDLIILSVGHSGKVNRIGDIDIDRKLQLIVNDKHPEDRSDMLKDILDSGAVSVVYDSSPAQAHLGNFERVKPALISGAVERYVTTKPVADSMEAYMKFKKLLDEPDNEGHPLKEKFFIHEHYLAKEPWVILRSNLIEAANRLGRFKSLTVLIQESQTVEGPPNRAKALKDGIMQDLMPHEASLSYDVYNILNSGGRYTISNHSEQVKPEIPTVLTFRYEPTDLGKDPKTGEYTEDGKKIDTGFIVRAKTTITDNQHPGEVHDLEYKWVGGKGTINKKEVIFAFENPDDPSKVSQIIVDFQNNEIRTIDVPPSVAELFAGINPDKAQRDNGYNKATASALTSVDPSKILQRWDEAFVARKWEALMRNRAKGTAPIGYPLDERPSLEELAERNVVRTVRTEPSIDLGEEVA